MSIEGAYARTTHKGVTKIEAGEFALVWNRRFAQCTMSEDGLAVTDHSFSRTYVKCRGRISPFPS